ncbi:unnamed protein product [Brassicogethes aeneus]|uniref:Uncharacterized protein n=1 Tax=Brassicogethes aeneus TaxID=1431903 RepID=A0A9P0B8X5_BRAAE|nr:unnamed protein product [Brassicogethes aeneus]
MLIKRTWQNTKYLKSYFKKYVSTYVQGQEPEAKIREYFYYIDHQGMLFLDDARMKNFTSCFKEKKFLRFFFNQMRLNDTDRYKEFPYLSICGKERNFIRCDDYPIVFTHVIDKKTREGNIEKHFAYNHAGDLLSIKFQPEKIVMMPETGRVYHPALERAGSIGLVQSKTAIEFSKFFEFDNGENNPPTRFKFEGTEYILEKNWYKDIVNKISC